MNKIARAIATAALTLASVIAATAQKPDQTLKNVIDKINNAPSVTLSFTLDTGDQNIAGQLTAAGNRFVITTDDGSFDTRFDGTTQWTWSQASGEVSMTTPTPEEIRETNPIEIIRTAPAIYNAAITQKTPQSVTLKLTPRNPRNTDIKEALLKIALPANIPQHLEVIMKDAQTMRFTFSNFTTGNKTSPRLFRYDPSLHPGAEIIDLR